jgi:hypothetical protein
MATPFWELYAGRFQGRPRLGLLPGPPGAGGAPGQAHITYVELPRLAEGYRIRHVPLDGSPEPDTGPPVANLVEADAVPVKNPMPGVASSFIAELEAVSGTGRARVAFLREGAGPLQRLVPRRQLGVRAPALLADAPGGLLMALLPTGGEGSDSGPRLLRPTLRADQLSASGLLAGRDDVTDLSLQPDPSGQGALVAYTAREPGTLHLARFGGALERDLALATLEGRGAPVAIPTPGLSGDVPRAAGPAVVPLGGSLLGASLCYARDGDLVRVLLPVDGSGRAVGPVQDLGVQADPRRLIDRVPGQIPDCPPATVVSAGGGRLWASRLQRGQAVVEELQCGEQPARTSALPDGGPADGPRDGAEGDARGDGAVDGVDTAADADAGDGGPPSDVAAEPDHPPVQVSGTCYEPIAAEEAGRMQDGSLVIAGDFDGATQVHSSLSCISLSAGVERVIRYRFSGTGRQRVVVTAEPASQVVVYARQDCFDVRSELAGCPVDGSRPTDGLALDGQAGDEVYLFVDNGPPLFGGAPAAPFTLSVRAVPIVGEDSPCDLAEEQAYCDRAARLRCLAAPGGGTPVCVAHEAPEIVSVGAAQVAPGPNLGLAIEVLDPSGVVVPRLEATFTFLDGRQADEPYGYAAGMARSGDRVTLYYQPFLFPGQLPPRSVSLRVHDADGLLSAPFVATLNHELAEACQPDAPLARCVAELSCEPGGCAAPPALVDLCDAPPLVDLSNGAVVLTGDLGGRVPSVVSCGDVFFGLERARAYRVRVPAAAAGGDLVAVVNPGNVNLAWREVCGDAGTTLACNGEPIGQPWRAAAVRGVAAGDHILVVSSSGGSQSYELEVAVGPRPARHLSEACDRRGIADVCQVGSCSAYGIAAPTCMCPVGTSGPACSVP